MYKKGAILFSKRLRNNIGKFFNSIRPCLNYIGLCFSNFGT